MLGMVIGIGMTLSDQAHTQAKILAVFPLNTVKDKS